MVDYLGGARMRQLKRGKTQRCISLPLPLWEYLQKRSEDELKPLSQVIREILVVEYKKAERA